RGGRLGPGRAPLLLRRRPRRRRPVRRRSRRPQPHPRSLRLALDFPAASDHNGHMRSKRKIGARELKTRLGRYLRAVRDGETIVVTERGEAVAELRPLPRAQTDLDARLAELAQTGSLTRGSGEPLPAFRPVTIEGTPISR